MYRLPHKRSIALELKSIFYFTGIPCPNGHISKRYAKRGQCVECIKVNKDIYRNSEKGKKKEKEYQKFYMKNYYIIAKTKKYGLTVNEYKNLFKLQNNKCAICNKRLAKKGRDTHIDHCHKTKKVRGILCRHCNVGLGDFKHNPELLRKAALYCEES